MSSLIKSLSKEVEREIKPVEMLGVEADVEWSQTTEGLEVIIGNQRGNKNGYAFKIGF